MDIREHIGNRITQSRKELGITIKELAARTQSLSPARISNWEQGTRSPGPLEAKLLAEHLKVSASYLLCLTDKPEGELIHSAYNSTHNIPVLKMSDALETKELIPSNFSLENTISIDNLNKSHGSEGLLAVRLEDNSMQPEFSAGDLVVLDSLLTAKPGDYVLAYLPSKKQKVLRKYGEAEDCLFQLLASNGLWATIHVKKDEDARLIGVVVEHRRYF